MDKLAEMALTVAVKKSLDATFEGLKSLMVRYKSELATPAFEIERAISRHQEEIASWASEVSFKDFPSGRRTSEIFVPLDIYVNQVRSRIEDEALPEIPLEAALAQESRSCVILGQPGAGKTTALKHICHRFAAEPKFLPQYQVLIRLQLRELNTTPSVSAPEYVSRSLQDLLRLRISYPNELAGDDSAQARKNIRDRVLIDWLNGVRALVLLDGFDEITLKARRDLVVEEMRRLAPQFVSAAFILTARSGEFNCHIEKVKLFEIKPLNDSQIVAFASQWLGGEHGPLFVQQLNRSPFRDTAIRPLTLAHLCVIYDRIKRIPEKPKSVYRKIVRLLLDEWDEQRSVVRESAYANFDSDRKAEFLANLAYELTSHLKTTSFNKDGLLFCYGQINENFGLPKNEATKVVDELETHTGLFLQSGRDRFEFSHKSLQEFLAAEFIVKLASIPSNMIRLQTMPNELAIATAISSRPSEYLTELVTHHFRRIRTSLQFTRSFVSRLLLEDPDFEQTPRVGYALLSLYLQYLNAVIHTEDQLSLFVMDQLGDDFAVLAANIKQRVTLASLSHDYNEVETSQTFDGDPVWHLKRKKRRQEKLRTSAETLLPDELWVRKSLLAESASAIAADVASGVG